MGGGSGCVKKASGYDAFFLRDLKPNVFKLQDLWMSEVGTKLDWPHGWDGRSLLVRKEFVDPLATRTFDTMLNVVRAKKKLLDFKSCEFVIVPNFKVCQGRVELETILAVHLFLVTACMAQHALEEM